MPSAAGFRRQAVLSGMHAVPASHRITADGRTAAWISAGALPGFRYEGGPM